MKVPNGTYKVTFLFCETKFDHEGQRVFDLKVQNTELLSGIDVFKVAGRDSIYSVSSGMVEVNNYTLNIDVLPMIGPSCMSGFIIEGRTADANQIKGTLYKRCINVGGGLYKDFEADLSERVGNKPLLPRDMSSASLYRDYALHEFGSEVADRAAAIFESLDGTEGNEGHLGFQMPRPAAWITGPGVIKPNDKRWEEEAVNYAFVDTLHTLRNQIKGKGNQARFDYWLNTFSCLKAMGQLGCMRGQLDKQIKKLDELSSGNAKQAFLTKEVIPLRIALSRKWEEMIGYLSQTISTSGEIGTLINLESQTRKTYGFLTRHDALLESVYGKELPDQIQLSTSYSLPPRLIVLNERTVLEKGEPYKLEVIIWGMKNPEEVPILMYRELGKGKFKAKKMAHEKQSVFSIRIPEDAGKTIEYYVTMDIKGTKLFYPASAPEMNTSWVFCNNSTSK